MSTKIKMNYPMTVNSTIHSMIAVLYNHKINMLFDWIELLR